MKIRSSLLKDHLANQKAWKRAYLIYGQDAALNAQFRELVVASVGGRDAKKELRIQKFDQEQLRGDIGNLEHHLKVRSFFGGQHLVSVSEVSEQLSGQVESALNSWNVGDAILVLSAGWLRKSSKLRKLFEERDSLACVAVYSEPFGRNEIGTMLGEAGVKGVSGNVLDDLCMLSREQEPALIKSFVAIISLYKFNDPTPLTSEDLVECMPEQGEVALDSLLDSVAGKRPHQIGQELRKLSRQESDPVRICIFAKRLFRNILRVAGHPEGYARGVSSLYPPVFGPRRQRIVSYARNWGTKGARYALMELAGLDRELRSGGAVPSRALVERILLRLAIRKV